MKYTSAEAGKLLKKLNDEQSSIILHMVVSHRNFSMRKI